MYTFITQHDQHKEHNGKFCQIVRPLRDGDEIDLAEVGPMYLVRLINGTEIHVFADELHDGSDEHRGVQGIE